MTLQPRNNIQLSKCNLCRILLPPPLSLSCSGQTNLFALTNHFIVGLASKLPFLCLTCYKSNKNGRRDDCQMEMFFSQFTLDNDVFNSISAFCIKTSWFQEEMHAPWCFTFATVLSPTLINHLFFFLLHPPAKLDSWPIFFALLALSFLFLSKF